MSAAPVIRPPMVPLIRAFAAAAGRTAEDLSGPCREQSVVALRRELIQKLYLEDYPVSAIARRLNRNHTTVLYHLGRTGPKRGRMLPRVERPQITAP